MIPHAIAVASSKGGTGKSSIVAALAVQAMADGEKVALLDWEPQGSLTLWWTMRGKPGNLHLIDNTDDPAEAIDLACVRGDAWVFLDTAPGEIDQIERAIMACDLCLIPVSASAFDLVAARTVKTWEAERNWVNNMSIRLAALSYGKGGAVYIVMAPRCEYLDGATLMGERQVARHPRHTTSASRVTG